MSTPGAEAGRPGPPAVSGRHDKRARPRGVPADERLLGACEDLLHEVLAFRRLRRQPAMAALRQRLVARVRDFQRKALASGIDPQVQRCAQYALCTLLDEVIASSEWASDDWSRHSLLLIFHNETQGGERFFSFLERAERQPGHYLPLLELFYLCLALGLEGRYRILRGGPSMLALRRRQLFETIRAQRELQVRPQASPRRPRRAWQRHVRAWLLSCCCLLVLVAALVAGFDLHARSGELRLRLGGGSAARIARGVRPLRRAGPGEGA